MIPSETAAYREFCYVLSVGSANTGVVCAFQSFWLLSGINFFVIAFAIVRLYLVAVAGDFAAQMLFIIMTYPALVAIRHDTNSLVSSWIHAVVSLFPALHWVGISVFPQWINEPGYLDKRQLETIKGCAHIDAAKEET